MTRIAANTSIIFSRLPFLDRFSAAKSAGFDFVEFWWPRAELDAGLGEDSIVDAVREAGVSVVMMNFDGGYLPLGDRGLAGDPTRADEFRASVPRTLDLAARLGCTKINALAGRAVTGEDEAHQLAILADSVAFAADQAAASATTVLIEPLNTIDTPGYLLPDADSGLALLARVARANAKLQLDVYHIARDGSDVIPVIRRAGSAIGHVQIADVPGRHEPGTGALPLASILSELGSVGYRGDLGLEYQPTLPETPDFSYLDWLRPMASSLTQPSPLGTEVSR